MVATRGITPSTTCKLPSVQLSTKYNLKMSNLCAQHDTTAKLSHGLFVTCVNAIRTIFQLTLDTYGQLFKVRLCATKCTHIPIITYNILIIIVLPCMCGPYMCRRVFPWTIWRAPYLSSNQKLLQVQECMHIPMGISTGSPQYVPYNAPMPHLCKRVLTACPAETLQYMPHRNIEHHGTQLADQSNKVFGLITGTARPLCAPSKKWSPSYDPYNVPWIF